MIVPSGQTQYLLEAGRSCLRTTLVSLDRNCILCPPRHAPKREYVDAMPPLDGSYSPMERHLRWCQ